MLCDLCEHEVLAEGRSKPEEAWEFPGGPMVRTRHFHCHGPGSIPGPADDTTLMTESEEELKRLLMKVKEESEKVGLKLNIQKMTLQY